MLPCRPTVDTRDHISRLLSSYPPDGYCLINDLPFPGERRQARRMDREKERSSLRSRLAFASVHLENEKIASLFWKLRHLILGEKFPTLSWAEILLYSFSQRRVANRISPIFNNDHARFNECNIFAQISASCLRKFFEKPAYMRPSKGVSMSPCRSFTNTPFAYLVREIPSHIHYLI